ncbi:MAG: hypothetical protein V3W44_09825 [Dehalococcoidales bacterium]
MAARREFKYHGKRYVLDSIELLRLVQKILTDTSAIFSRGDRAATAEMLNPIIHKLGAVEEEYDKHQHARQQEEEKDDDPKYHVPRILFDVSIHQNLLPGLLLKLRRSEAFPLTDILTEGEYGAIPVTVDSHVTVLFNETETVLVRVFLKGDILPKTILHGNA